MCGCREINAKKSNGFALELTKYHSYKSKFTGILYLVLMV